MKIWLVLIAIPVLATSFVPFSKAISVLCYLSPWDVETCRATVTYNDGTTKEVVFQTKNKTISTCYEFGCHPVYCSNWRDDLRNSCKAEYEELMRSGQSSLFTDKNKKITSISFDGCARARYATGALALFDHLVRSLAPESYSHLCSTDSPAEEWSVKNQMKGVWSAMQKLPHDYMRKIANIGAQGSLANTSP